MTRKLQSLLLNEIPGLRFAPPENDGKRPPYNLRRFSSERLQRERAKQISQ